MQFPDHNLILCFGMCVQGQVVSVVQEGSNAELTVSDGSGPILTVCFRPAPGQTVPEPGQYVLLVGRLGHRRVPGELQGPGPGAGSHAGP